MSPEGLETGRIWGKWNEELLPVQWETVKVTLKDAYRIRRVYRRLAKRKGRERLHRLTVFVRYENVVRLLEFLAYRQEEYPRTSPDTVTGDSYLYKPLCNGFF